MKYLVLVLSLISFNITPSFAIDCESDAGYQRARAQFRVDLRDVMYKYQDDLRKCGSNAADPKLCQTLLVNMYTEQDTLSQEFIKNEHNAYCLLPKNQDNFTISSGGSNNSSSLCAENKKVKKEVIDLFKIYYQTADCKNKPESMKCDNILAEFAVNKAKVDIDFPCESAEDKKAEEPKAQPQSSTEHEFLKRGNLCLTTDKSLASNLIITWNQNGKRYYYTSCTNVPPGGIKAPTKPECKPPQGLVKVGRIGVSTKCENNQLVIQACRDLDKEVESCVFQCNEVYAKCGEKQDKTPEICFDKNEIVNNLASPYTMCKVSEEDYKKYEVCLTSQTKNDKAKLCPNGCANQPKKDFCDWNESEVNQYLGCVGIVSKEQWEMKCNKVEPPKTDPPKTDPPKNMPPKEEPPKPINGVTVDTKGYPIPNSDCKSVKVNYPIVDRTWTSLMGKGTYFPKSFGWEWVYFPKGKVMSVKLDIKAAIQRGEWGGSVRPETGQVGPGMKYYRVSECKGDTPDAYNPLKGNKHCDGVNATAAKVVYNGHIPPKGDTSAAHYHKVQRDGRVMAKTYCHLDPNKTYYMNFIMYDHFTGDWGTCSGVYATDKSCPGQMDGAVYRPR